MLFYFPIFSFNSRISPTDIEKLVMKMDVYAATPEQIIEEVDE